MDTHTHTLAGRRKYLLNEVYPVHKRYTLFKRGFGRVEFNFKILNSAFVQPETLASQDNRNGVSVNRSDWIFHIT
jgi:hypothetical protein